MNKKIVCCVLLVLLASTTAFAVGTHQGRGVHSFIPGGVSSAADLIGEVQNDSVLQARYVKHFSLPVEQIFAQPWQSWQLGKSQVMTVYCVKSDGRIYSTQQRVSGLEWVAGMAGKPIILLDCGNPVTKSIPCPPPCPAPKQVEAYCPPPPLPPPPAPRPCPIISGMVSSVGTYPAPSLSPNPGAIQRSLRYGATTRTFRGVDVGVGWIKTSTRSCPPKDQPCPPGTAPPDPPVGGVLPPGGTTMPPLTPPAVPRVNAPWAPTPDNPHIADPVVRDGNGRPIG